MEDRHAGKSLDDEAMSAELEVSVRRVKLVRTLINGIRSEDPLASADALQRLASDAYHRGNGTPEALVTLQLENEEMYGEPFSIPEPLETVFISWFQGGEVFRSGATWRRGRGNIFYFRPGHETYPTYHNPVVGQVLRNAVHWAYNPVKPIRDDVTAAPNWPVDKALEQIEERGGKLHKPGDKGLR